MEGGEERRGEKDWGAECGEGGGRMEKLMGGVELLWVNLRMLPFSNI